jgi:hypothetical protein
MSAPLPRYRVLLAAGALFLVTMLAHIKIEVNCAFWDPFMDAAHVPIFGCLMWLLYATNPAGLASRAANYRFSIFVALVAAAAVEILQSFIGRSGNVDDWFKGALGIGLAALILGGWRCTGAAAAVIALGVVLTPTVHAARAMLWRAVHFPLLADFESSAETALWLEVDRDSLISPTQRRRVPSHAVHGAYSLRVPIRRGQWPGVRLLCADQNWSAFSVFAFDVQNNDLPFTLSVRIDDSRSTGGTNRYCGAFSIERGLNRIRIPLAEIGSQPRSGPLDLRAIRRVVFFEDWSADEHTYFLDYVRLE